MDISWIPGDADALVLLIAAVVAVGGVAAGLARRSRALGSKVATPEVEQEAKPQAAAPPTAPPPTATPPTATPAPRAEPAVGPEPAVTAPPEATPPAAAPPADLVEHPESTAGRFSRLKGRLSLTLGATLGAVLRRGAMSTDDYDALEEALLLADVGAASADVILDGVRSRLAANAELEPREALREALIEIIDPGADRSLALGAPGKGETRSVIVVGVNGVGKTTTVGKLARVLVADGYSVVLGAADTFRAAAADQLETWGARVGVPVERSERDGADPASVAFAAAERAVGDSTDALLIDTAGRLQNKAGLMDELGKIVRVVGKVVPRAEVLLVLDATTGQNGLAQAKVFAEATAISGIVLTKLDGSAKGGIVVAVQRELGVPVKFVGLGEGADDLAPFDPIAFVDSLVGDA